MKVPEKLRPLLPPILHCVTDRYVSPDGPVISGKHFHRTVKVVYRYKELSFFKFKEQVQKTTEYSREKLLGDDKHAAKIVKLQDDLMESLKHFPNVIRWRQETAAHQGRQVGALDWTPKMSYLGLNARGEPHAVGWYEGEQVTISFRKRPVVRPRFDAPQRLIYDEKRQGFYWVQKENDDGRSTDA